MLANYGFKDGSGSFFITIDTDKCDGCGKCAEACPEDVFEIGEDEIDPFREEPVAKIKKEDTKKIKFTCAPCKPIGSDTPLPCVTACEPGAITHSW